ncbi:hypothetical protein [Streptomyces oryzae]|nr:hypothetical protein [Streptomyces oryzae]
MHCPYVTETFRTAAETLPLIAEEPPLPQEIARAELLLPRCAAL